MTSLKKLLTALLVIALLSGVALWLVRREHSSSLETLNPLNSLGLEAMRKVRIQVSASGELVLERSGDDWKMTVPFEDFVEPMMSDKIVSSVRNATIGPVISDSPESHAKFEVSSGTAVHLQVFTVGQEVPVLDGYVGKAGARYEEAYFRFEGSNEIRLMSGLPVFILRTNPDFYRSRKLFQIAPANAVEIEINTGKQHYNLVHSSADWVNTLDNKAMGPVWMGQLLDKMEEIRVDSFGVKNSSSNPVDIGAPLVGFRLKNAAGEFECTVGQLLKLTGGPTTHYQAVSKGRGNVLLIDKTTVDGLLKHLKAFSDI